MRDRPLLTAGLLCGLIAPLLWLAAIVACGALRPGFDHVAQYISELGERGSSTEMLMRYAGFVPTGLMHIGFAAALFACCRDGDRPRLVAIAAALVAINGLGRIGAGMFPCEPGCAAPLVATQRLHSLAATIGFFALIGATLLGGVVFRGSMRLRPLAPFSFTCGSLGLGFLVLMAADAPGAAMAGLYERLASGVLSVWVFATAGWLWWQRNLERRTQ